MNARFPVSHGSRRQAGRHARREQLLHPREQVLHPREVGLVDLLDRLLAGGVVIRGQVTLAAADIDLVQLDLAILLASVDKAMSR